MKKSVYYSIVGGLMGLGVALLSLFLIFINLGVVGIASPAFTLMLSTLLPLGGYWGFIFANQTQAAVADEYGWLPVSIAYLYGVIALTTLRYVTTTSSFLFGLSFLTLTMVILLIHSHHRATKRKEVQVYPITPMVSLLALTLVFSLLTYHLFPLIAGGMITLVYAGLLRFNRKQPKKEQAHVHLRYKEIALESVMGTHAASALSEPERVNIHSDKRYRKTLLLLFVLVGLSLLATYLLQPMFNEDIALYLLFTLTILLAALFSGVSIVHWLNPRNTHAKS